MSARMKTDAWLCLASKLPELPIHLFLVQFIPMNYFVLISVQNSVLQSRQWSTKSLQTKSAASSYLPQMYPATVCINPILVCKRWNEKVRKPAQLQVSISHSTPPRTRYEPRNHNLFHCQNAQKKLT